MVNVKMIGRFTGPPNPCEVGEDRKIPNGPLFTKSEIQIALNGGRVRTVTEKCRKNLQALGLDLDDLKELISEAIISDCYKDSEWDLVNSARGVWIACDAYVLKREEWINSTTKKTVRYYLKFSLSDVGEMVLTVSCHL